MSEPGPTTLSDARLCACGCKRPAPTGRWPSERPKFIQGHATRRPLAERFEKKVKRADNLSPNGTAGCLLWTGWKTTDGYGVTSTDGIKEMAHRAAWRLAGMPEVAAALQLDHLCRRRHCVNVEHLEVVTGRENVLRGATVAAAMAAKTHCKHGHPFSPDNTHVSAKGHRTCLTCRRANGKAYRERKHAAI